MSAVAETRYGILQFLPDDGDAAVSLDWYGEWLQPQLALLARFIVPGAVVLEAGAGIGAHAMLLAEAAGAEGHLFVHESSAMRVSILRQNLAANRIGPVTVLRGNLRGAGEDGESLDALRMDRLHLVKVGGDAPALDIIDGGAETLWRLRPFLFLAAPDEATLVALTERVREFGYRCWRVTTPLFNVANFNRRDADVFGGRYALALLAIPEEIEVEAKLEGCVELT